MPQRGTSLDSYANTQVTPGRSKEQIEALLIGVGAKGFRWSSEIGLPGKETIEAVLEWNEREIGFRLAVSFEDEREKKRRLRALYWYLKAKIEAIHFGLVDLEQEFLPYLITPSGRTMYDELGGPEMKLLPERVAEGELV